MAGALIPRGFDQGTYWFTLVVFPVAGGAVTVIAGVLVLIREPRGLHLSFLVQASQVLAFTGTWRFVFRTGLWATWLINSSGTGLVPGFGGMAIATTAPPDGTLNALGYSLQFTFGFFGRGRATTSWAVGINLVALYFTILLWRVIRYLAAQRAPATVPPAA